MLLPLLLLGCSDSNLSALPPVELAEPELAFDDASSRTGVPQALLLAIAKVETGVESVEGEEEFPGQEPAFGIMGLRGENLEEGAALAGLDPEQVRSDVSANTLAAATLLAAWGEEARAVPGDLSSWAPVVARYSGIEDEEAKAEYVWYEVYAALQKGVDQNGYQSKPDGSQPRYPRPSHTRARTGDAGAVWTASPNYSSRSGYPIDYVIIHTCEGSYSGCWSWLASSASGVSAHYVVNDDGSEVRQLVDEANKAWHISATYDCDNNGGYDCSLDGTSLNYVTVGIEHAGYGSNTSWNSSLISRSAALACGITERQGIPRDAYHIVGHGQLQPYNRSDPGAAWPWSDYLDQIKDACGDTTVVEETPEEEETEPTATTAAPTDSSFVIDSNNANNDEDWYSLEVSANWWSSTSATNYYGSGYWVAPTAAVSDPASFWFLTDESHCYNVDAWWTSGSNRPAAISWMGWDENDREVGRTTVNMQGSGGQWNRLGTWTFPAGWNRVLLSRWTTTGYYAIADGVRLTPC